jgi:OOP family OmpA-OmpF porin
MKQIKNIALVAALVAAFPTASNAVEINPSWYVQPSVNVMKQDGDFLVPSNGRGAGLAFGKMTSPNWDVQYGFSSSRAKDGGRSYKQEVLDVTALFMPASARHTITPFLLVGAGVQRHSSWLSGDREFTPFVSGGGGVRIALGEQWALQGDLRAVKSLSDVGRVSRPYNKLLTIGLNYYFGKPVHAAPVVVAEPAPAPVVEAAPAPAPVAPPARFEKVTVSATELFAFDKAVLAPNQPKLDEIAAMLNKNQQTGPIVVSGYTDRIGSDRYNEALSLRRAEAVKAYLVAKGVAGERISTAGKGEANPVVQCNDKNRTALIECLAPNRRGEVEEITVERGAN